MYNTIISAQALQSLIGSDELVVLDCRFSLADSGYGARVYSESHVPGAHYLHLDDDLSSPITPHSGRHPLPDIEQLSGLLHRCGVSSSSQVVVYDDCGGAMAARAWWLLRWLGHDAVAVLDGGYPAWSAAGGEQSVVPAAQGSGNFTVRLREDMNLDVEQVAALPARILLVDARGAERYRGEQEPIDPVAGHIPGAVNRPLTDNLNNGVFKPADQLRHEWEALLGVVEPAEVVHYCGSGVTACHNLLAMEYAGLNGSRIYAGSWSEWIRDPQRPVATGG